MNQSLEAARKTLTDLQTKRDQAETRKLALEAERDDLAFDALTGDAKAMKKLTEVNVRLIEVDLELASFAAAIRTAEEKVQEARGIELREIERKKGEEALKLGRELRDRAARADQAMRDTFENLGAMYETALALSRIRTEQMQRRQSNEAILYNCHSCYFGVGSHCARVAGANGLERHRERLRHPHVGERGRFLGLCGTRSRTLARNARVNQRRAPGRTAPGTPDPIAG